MEKKLVVAIALSILVIVLFQFMFPRREAVSPVIQRATSEPALLRQEALPAAPSEEQEFKQKETFIETNKYIFTFTNIGGSLKDVELKEYPDPHTKVPLRLVSGAEREKGIFSLESDALIKGLEIREFKIVKKERRKLSYAYSVPGKFSIVKEYAFHNTNDYIELRILIQNLGKEPVYKDYNLLGASSLQPTSQVMGRRFEEIDSMVDGKIVRNNKVKNGEATLEGIVSWTGVKERYFCIILRPQQESGAVILRQFGKKNLASGIRSRRTAIYPGSATKDSYLLYIGPNDTARLSGPGVGFEHIISYGVFGGISKILLTVLRLFYKVVHNWGVAIIMLTFLINIILFPLTKKSFSSMQKIQQVQPHMEKLRKLHKDNAQKLNKEMAELYKQYNVNPFGGCLPLLIQMPIFIALYQGLIRSIELKGANFLWIKDLSSPDFVTIPVTLPLLGDKIHILPLLMVAAMFLQQRISAKSTAGASPEQQQQQKFMMIFFPIFFGFLFYNFPSGLVLYWLTNTVLMVIEHSAIRKSTSA